MQNRKLPAQSKTSNPQSNKKQIRTTAPVESKLRLRTSVDGLFLVIIILLLCIGTLMVFSASYAYAKNKFSGDSFHFVKQQTKFVILGIITLFFVSRVDYMIVRKLQPWLFWGSLALLFLVPFIGIDANGARRWIAIGPFQIQPSEVVKISMILYFTDYNLKHRNKDNFIGAWIYKLYYPLCRRSKFKFFRKLVPPKNRMKTFWTGIFPYGLFLVYVGYLMYIQPHLSGLIIIGLETVVMMILGQCSWKWLAVGGVSGVGAMAGLITFSEHAQKRIAAWLTPFEKINVKELTKDAWQPYQSLLAIGSGGLWGVGLGNSKQKHLFLPEPQNDYIFSILCEEMGFVFATFVILLFAVFVLRGFRIALRAPDKYSKIVVMGIITKIALQVILNIAVVTNTLPSTGVPLPFFSYGGTALIILMAEMGLVLNISKYSFIEK